MIGTLYQTEIKKIISKKSVWITLLIGMLLFSAIGMSKFFFDRWNLPDGTNLTGKEYYTLEREKGEGVTGRSIDDNLLSEIRAEINTVLSENKDVVEKIPAADEDDIPGFYFAAQKLGWENFFYILATGVEKQGSKKLMEASADELIVQQRNYIEQLLESDRLDEDEQAYWLSRYEKIEKPYVYSYSAGYQLFYLSLYVLIWFVFLFIVIALAGTFSEESQVRMDALILSCKNGRKPICIAKMLAGITLSVASMMFMLFFELAIVLITYGHEGWQYPIQNICPYVPWDITIGQGMGMIFGIAILLALLFSVFTQLLSLFFKNTSAALALQAGILVVSIFNIPYSMGIASKIWRYRPTNFLNQCFAEWRLFSISGHKVNCFEMAAVVYICMIILSILVVFVKYNKVQVESR